MTEHAVVLARKSELCGTAAPKLPALVSKAGPAAVFATEEFFHGKIRNPNTRAAYERAVRKFLEWCDLRGLELHTVQPKHVGEYMDLTCPAFLYQQ